MGLRRGTGKAFVYGARTGAPVTELQLATGAGTTFINDVVVTWRAAYFTDSQRPVIYKVAESWRTGSPAAVTAIPLTGDYQHVAGFNLNGIDATPSGRTLLAVQSATGKLFTIDPKTGSTSSSTSAARRFRTATASFCTAGRCTSCRTS